MSNSSGDGSGIPSDLITVINRTEGGVRAVINRGNVLSGYIWSGLFLAGATSGFSVNGGSSYIVGFSNSTPDYVSGPIIVTGIVPPASVALVTSVVKNAASAGAGKITIINQTRQPLACTLYYTNSGTLKGAWSGQVGMGASSGIVLSGAWKPPLAVSYCGSGITGDGRGWLRALAADTTVTVALVVNDGATSGATENRGAKP